MARKALTKFKAKALQAKSSALSKQYKAEAAALKKAGVLSSRIDARKNITRSTRTKINKFRDVLEGKVSVVRAKPQTREAFSDKFEERGPFLIVKKERKKETVKIIRRGEREGLQIIRDLLGPDGLKYGEEREVIFPFKLTDMPSLVDKLQTDETLDGLKNNDEFFSFRLDGWAARTGFVDAKEMGDYISINYSHLFKANMSKKVVKYLSFVRYKNTNIYRLPEHGHKGLKPKPFKPFVENKYAKRRRLENDARRKKFARERETEADRKIRLDKQRIRSAQNRQKKFEDK